MMMDVEVVEQPQPDGTLLLCHPTKPWSLLWDPKRGSFESQSSVAVFCDPSADHWFTAYVPKLFSNADNQGINTQEQEAEAAWMNTIIQQYGARTVERGETVIGGHRTFIEPCVTALGNPGVKFRHLASNGVTAREVYAVREACGELWLHLEGDTEWISAVKEYAATHYPIPMEETND